MWRGTVARRFVKRKRAARRICIAYSRYKLRAYVGKLIVLFKNVKSSKDFGKRVVWPTPPPMLKKTVEILKKILRRWRAYMILKPYPMSERPSLRLKVTAGDVLKGRRQTWGFQRKWEGNYLINAEENLKAKDAEQALAVLKETDQYSKVLFAGFVKKTNKHNQTSDRAILITDKHIYKLDPKNKFKAMKPGIPLSDITGLSLGAGPDQLICIHLANGNDFVICTLPGAHNHDYTGEVIGTLTRYWQISLKKNLKLEVGPQLQCTIANKPKEVSALLAKKGPVFRKKGNGLVLHWPEPIVPVAQ
jgi:myosin-1